MSDKSSEKSTDITILRRDKLSAIIERGNDRIQQIITGAGIDPGIARAVAAAIMVPIIRQALPVAARVALAEAESALSARMTALSREVYRATEKEIESILDE